MGQLYDSPAVYDSALEYDAGAAPGVVSPNLISPIGLQYSTGAADQTQQTLRWATLSPNIDAVRGASSDADIRKSTQRMRWGALAPRNQDIRVRSRLIAARENTARARWGALHANASVARLHVDAAAKRFSELLTARWQMLGGRQIASALAWGAIAARQSSVALAWRRLAEQGAWVRIRWKLGAPQGSSTTLPIPGDPDLPPGSTIVIPPAEAYFMIPSLSIVRTSDGADLDALDATISLDEGSYAWTLDATIPRQSLPLVDPNPATEPVLIDASINGYSWRFIVESYGDNRKIGGTGCRIKGRSQSALLGAPYAPLSTYTSTTNADASQLADALMPTGWTLTWSAPDWLVPAGLFTYADKAPIDALAQLAGAIGARIVPDVSAQLLTISPMYPVNPWDWATATPYADIPASFFLELGGQWEGNFKTNYNGIFVGGQNGGVFGRIKRAGSSGDVLISTVTDPLIVHVDAARERGRNELAKAGKRKTETMRTILLPPGGTGNPGIFMPSSLLKVRESQAQWSAADWFGKVTSVQISATKSTGLNNPANVRQIVTVERQA